MVNASMDMANVTHVVKVFMNMLNVIQGMTQDYLDMVHVSWGMTSFQLYGKCLQSHEYASLDMVKVSIDMINGSNDMVKASTDRVNISNVMVKPFWT
jgi:hypothetical protein